MACLYTAHFGKSPCGGALFRIGRDSGVLPVSFSERQSLPSSLLFQSPLPLLSLSTLLTLSLSSLFVSLANCHFSPPPCPKTQPRSRSPSATSSLLVLLPVCLRYACILNPHSLFRALRPVANSHTLVDSYHVCAINNSLSHGDIGIVIGFEIGRIG